ncbi:MAG TPA: hypothetical protein VNS63_08365 [Blastocatellia bacterium]|nr:hypothetical protein [Blastocatellia bacterium]
MPAKRSPKTPPKSSHRVAQAASLRPLKPARVGFGFRVKSGRAIAVALTSAGESPQVLARREITLCDAAVPDSIQPYHAALEVSEQKASKVIERLVKLVKQATTESVTQLLKEWRVADYEIVGAGLVVGSVIDPAKIANDHIRAHALEGQLFRVAMQEALQSNGLTSIAIPEREVYSTAAAALARSEDELKGVASELGRMVGGPWRSEEKTAALAAWMVLR